MYFQLLPTRKENRAWNSMSEWNKEIEKFFDGVSESDYLAPPCEIVDQEKAYAISLDIPGFRKDQIEIEVKDRRLHVSGQRDEVKRAETETVLRQERRFGKFNRIFTLPDNIQEEGILAKFENGVLNITLPKTEKSQSRKVTISETADPTLMKN